MEYKNKQNIQKKYTRRDFLQQSGKNLLIILSAIILGEEGINIYRKYTFEKQIIQGRIIGIPKEELKKILGKDVSHKTGFIFYNNILRIDIFHLGWIDQGHDLWENIKKLQNPETKHITIHLHDQRKFLSTYSNNFSYSLTKQNGCSPSTEILQKIFTDIVLHLRDTIERQQRDNYIIRNIGITAGCDTDINANILGTLLATKTDLISEIYNTFGKKDKTGKYIVNFKNKEIIQYIFPNIIQGKNALQTISRDNIISTLIKEHKRTTTQIKEQYPYIEIQKTINTF